MSACKNIHNFERMAWHESLVINRIHAPRISSIKISGLNGIFQVFRRNDKMRGRKYANKVLICFRTTKNNRSNEDSLKNCVFYLR